MKYSILISCISHIGLLRKNNQDNFLCDHQYMVNAWDVDSFPIQYSIQPKGFDIVGVFDGMGGEECGEIASRIAAQVADQFHFNEPMEDLRNYCMQANEQICDYASAHGIGSMGTTAAMLVFGKRNITLCNIGDSKILRYSNSGLEQISVDHIVPIEYGAKAPLSQNLGIPPEELVIDPYIASGYYNDGDLYILCSDGLTDMVSPNEMIELIQKSSHLMLTRNLVNRALENGGKDNITVITCNIKQNMSKLDGLFGNKE